jgi:hypothetical protein
VLEAGGAETQPGGEALHRLRLLEFARDNLENAENPGVRGRAAMPVTPSRRRWGESQNTRIPYKRRNQWRIGMGDHDDTLGQGIAI